MGTTTTPTVEQLAAKIDELEALIELRLPVLVEGWEPILLEQGAKKPLSQAPREWQLEIVARRDKDFAQLLNDLGSTQLSWSIAQGLY